LETIGSLAFVFKDVAAVVPRHDEPVDASSFGRADRATFTNETKTRKRIDSNR
jgi:hypothetical protein